MAFCKITLIGNLGGDPEMRYTPNGKSVAQFSVAVNQGTKNPQTGEWTDATDWFRVTIWGERGERVAETARKGDKVLVDGRFKTRQWESKQDGTMRTSLDVTAETVVALGARRSEEDASPAHAQRAVAESEDTLDDLPF